jgi:Flp pilus assembly protein TadD
VPDAVVGSGAPGAGAEPDSAPLVGPPGAERAPRESAPAPLLVPGRPSPADTALRDRPARAREQYQKGRGFEGLQAFAAAILSYQRAVRLDPAIPDANYRMGLLFARVGRIREAVKAYRAELAHHPGKADATRELGLGLAQLGEHERAVALLERLTREHPSDGAAWRALGFAHMQAGRTGDAETALRRAIALPPPDAAEHRDLAFVLSATGREAEARAEYRRAIAMDPKEAASWVNLGNLDRAAGDLATALTDYRQAEKRDSAMTLAMVGQAQVLLAQQRGAEAAEAYRRLLVVNPGDDAVRLAVVRLYDSLGRADIALEVARDGVRADARSAQARLILGLALQAQGRWRDAALEMRRAESLSRDSAGQARARSLVAALRAAAPDSLRASLEADSVAFVRERSRRVSPVETGAGGRPDSSAVAPQPVR